MSRDEINPVLGFWNRSDSNRAVPDKRLEISELERRGIIIVLSL